MSVRFVAYNEEQSTLRLQFDGGEVYDYFIVPPDVARHAEVALADGGSPFFRSSIRGVYPSRRVS